MEKDDVLTSVQKYYISIMAVSCYDCEYLLKILEEQFLLNGGNIEWLTSGLSKADRKLQRLGEINEIMAYRPWILSSSHIEYLAKGDEKDPNSNWTIP